MHRDEHMRLHRLLRTAALSNLGAMGALTARNLLDTIYAARVSAEALAALTVTVPLTALLIGLSQGISVSTGNSLALSGNVDRDDRGVALVPAALQAALMGGALVVLFLYPLAMIVQGSSTNPTVARASSLGGWIILTAPLLFLFGTLTSLLRALGHASAAARATVVGIGVGAAVTPLLLLAAWASGEAAADCDPLIAMPIGLATGYATSCILLIMTLRRMQVRCNPFCRFDPVAGLRILRAALPVVGNSLAGLLAMFIIVAVFAEAGVVHASAYGVVFRLEQIGLVALNAVVLAMVPMVARALGQGDRTTIALTIRVGIRTIFVMGAGIGLAFAAGSGLIITWFQLPDAAATLAWNWLIFSGLAMAFQGVVLAGTSLLQIRRPTLSFVLSVLRLYGLVLPALLVASAGCDAWLYQAISGAQILAGICAFFLLHYWCRRNSASPGSSTSMARE